MVKHLIITGIIFLILSYLYMVEIKAPHKDNQQPTITATIALPEKVQSHITPVENPDRLVILINEERKARGLNELVETKELDEVVSKRVTDIYSKAQWNHDGFVELLRQSGFKGAFGENIARGYAFENNDGLLRAWIESPEHAENLFNSNYRYIGIARSGSGAQGSNGWDTYVVAWMGEIK